MNFNSIKERRNPLYFALIDTLGSNEDISKISLNIKTKHSFQYDGQYAF